jgi:uncharacterized membrane protein
MVRKTLSLIIVLIVAVTAGISLLHSGLPPTHDGEYHVVRFIEFDRVLRSGDLYPRWAPDLNFGFGVPLFNYVYPLPNFLASFFHLFGVNFIDSFKFVLFGAILFAGIFFYFWTKSIFGKKAAVVGATFYLFSPYMFVDAYIRGSIGEVLALALFPALLWSLTELFYNNKKLFLPISSIFLGLIIFSHNILALMFFPVVILYSLLIIFLSKNIKHLIIKLFLLTSLGLSLAAIFWMPALMETKYVVGLQIFDFKNNFPESYQLLFPSWGSGFFGGTAYNQMSVQIGVANLLAIVIGIVAFVRLRGRKESKNIFIIFFLSLFLVITFLMLRVSLPVWETVPLMNYFQFPWRFLSLIILSCSFIAAGCVFVFKQKIFVLVMFALPILFAYSYAHPAYFMNRTDSYYATRSNFIDGTNSVGNSFNTVWFRGEHSRVGTLTQSNSNLLVKNITRNPTKYSFTVIASQSSKLVLNTAYFPGWNASIDGESKTAGFDPNGILSIDVPKGQHNLRVFFSDTLIRKISLFVSIASVIFIITLIFKNWYIKER